MPARTPQDRILIARIAAAERWARTSDRTAATAAARQALLTKYEREVDPDDSLDPAERARRADQLRRAALLRASRAAAAKRRARTQRSAA